MRNIYTEIVNQNENNCNFNATLKNNIDCADSEFDSSKISQETIADVVSKCYQDAINQTDIIKKMEDITDQTAKTETKGVNLFGGFFMIIIIAVGAFFMFNQGLDQMIIILAALGYYFFIHKKINLFEIFG